MNEIKIICAMKLIERVDKIEFATLTKTDLKLLLDFLTKKKNNNLKIKKSYC